MWPLVSPLYFPCFNLDPETVLLDKDLAVKVE